MTACHTYAMKEYLKRLLGALAYHSTHSAEVQLEPAILLLVSINETLLWRAAATAARHNVECYTSLHVNIETPVSSHSLVIVMKHAPRMYST